MFLKKKRPRVAAPLPQALVCFQAGYFCLPTVSEEAQQLLVSAPVTQRRRSQRRRTVAPHYIILAHCLDNFKIIEGDERCDSCAFSPQGDVLSESFLVFRVSQAVGEDGNESPNQRRVRRGHRLQDAVHLPVVHAFVLLHKRPAGRIRNTPTVSTTIAA